MRESAQSWRELLIDIKQRGLQIAPEIAVGDGALGFWKALDEICPGTRHQRCWVHKTVNVLDKVPLSVQANMKSRRAAGVLRFPRRALGSFAHDQPHRKRVRDRAAQGGAHQGIVVADHRQADGVQAGHCRIKDLAAAQRHKSVAEGDCRCQIQRRHRGHPHAGKPRRLIASSPKIPHSSGDERSNPFRDRREVQNVGDDN